MEPLPGHVDGPPAQPQRGGLVDAAWPGQTTTPNGEAIRWELGVQCWFENGAGWTVVHDGTADLDDDDTEVDYGNADMDPAPVAGRPVMLRTSVRGPRPSRGSDLQTLMRNRVLRRLDAITSQAMARELWTGRLTQSQPYQLTAGYGWTNPTPDSGATFCNPFLNASVASDANIVRSGTTYSAMRALGEIETRLGDLVAGGPLVIHVPRTVVNELAWTLQRVPIEPGDTALELGGQDDGAGRFRLYTAAGSLVVADTGYPGWGPGIDEDNTDAERDAPFMWGTGPVMAWLGEPTEYDRLETVVNPRTNQAEMWAERPFLTLFDPSTVVGVAVSPST